MPRKKRGAQPERSDELLDPCGRQRCRFPAWWADTPAEELDAAHRRAKALRERGYGAVIWGESTSGEIFDPG